MKSIAKLLRKLVPSTAILSYNPVFKILGYLADILPNMLFPEFRKLPPNHLRVRVGVGNKIFFNQVLHLERGYSSWIQWLRLFQLNSNSNILDIGCGCGRLAEPLNEISFTGTYTGIDIDKEMIDFCKTKFTRQNFVFYLSNHKSAAYSETKLSEVPKNYYTLPLNDGTQDFVYSTSLLTHLLEDELLNYINESFRVLKTGGNMSMSFFCLDALKDLGSLGGRWTFTNSIGNAFVESMDCPEAAVAYEQEFIKRICKNVGFSEVDFILTNVQSAVLVTK